MSSMDITVPDLGDFDDVEIIEVLVAVGDRVQKEDGLLTLETDKAAFDVPAPANGKITALTVSVGDRVSTGSVIGSLAAEVSDTVLITPALSADETEQTVADSTTASAAKAGGIQTLVVPNLGDFEDAEVIEVLISAGQSVAVEDPLITLETDKAAMDVPAVAAGVITEVLVNAGEKLSEGSAIALLETAAGEPQAEPAPEQTIVEKPAVAQSSSQASQAPAERAAAARPATGLPPINETGFARSHASPSVRKLARELGVDLGQVEGTGPRQRVLHDDVKAFVKRVLSGGGGGAAAALPQTPEVDYARFGDIETQPLSRIQKISGPRLQASWINLPHVTQHDLADITDLEAKRQQLKGPAKARGIGLTPLAFILKACVAALDEFPKVKSSLSADGKSLVYKHYCHLGFAADTDKGLMVPVIRHADKKDIYEIAQELGELSALAREGKLKAEQMQGATFTVTSLGGIGGTAFTPIVNAPEVAILGVSRSSMQPVWNGTEFEPRLLLPLSLSYDHRVIDGAQAVRFTTYLGQMLGDVDNLLQAIP